MRPTVSVARSTENTLADGSIPMKIGIGEAAGATVEEQSDASRLPPSTRLMRPAKAQVRDHSHNLGEQVLRNRDLGHLERDRARAADDLRSEHG